MNKLKPLIASLIILSSMPGLSSADKTPSPNGFGFAGVGIGSSQYLGIYLSNPATPILPTKPATSVTPTTPQVCNADIQVLGIDGLPVGVPLPTQIIQQGGTVFLAVDEATVDPATTPQYLNVSVKITIPSGTTTDTTAQKSKKTVGCTGVMGVMGVYDKTTQSLQVLVPMLPAPLK